MATNYTIYLVNQSSSTQTFWCFLTRPAEIASDALVYANSSASLAIDSNDQSINSFTIPVQYIVSAGASNNAVGLGVQINSTITQDSDLTEVWNASYANVPPNKGPKLVMDTVNSVGPNSLKLVTNSFDQASNESLGWFASQSFGIQTDAGFVGMTWSPSPNQNRTLTPKLNFYIAVGGFGESTLADWTQVSNESAAVNVPGSFSTGASTVTYLNNGKWKVTPGKPPKLAMLDNLAFLTSDEHNELAAMAYLASGKAQSDVITAVSWPKAVVQALDDMEDVANTVLTGTITVGTALAAGFAYFLISGVSFTINSTPQGNIVNFTYSGPSSAQAIKDLVVAGATAVFGGSRA